VTPFLLDISRLISRVGRGPFTGIDRVELAYFRELLDRPEPVFFLCRMPKSYAILDRGAGCEIFNKINGKTKWGSRGLARLVAPGATPDGQAALADVWRLAQGKTPVSGLRDCFKRLFPSGVKYFNVGHSNLRGDVFEAVKRLEGSTIIVLIHDVIPLDYPQYSRPEVTERFQGDLERVGRFADRVIYNSELTQRDAERYFQGWGRMPEGVVAHLGIDMPSGGASFLAASERPSFCVVGTIEPRKNHLMLLEIWQGFAATLPAEEVPELHIMGRRGWNNENVFKILDTDPMIGVHVFEHNSMSDSELQEQLAKCWATLFPSFAEGFGLPLVEAALLGVPVICGENAIYREILGDYPLYLNVDNSYRWSQRILGRAGRIRESEVERQVRGKSVTISDWNGHFDRIFRFV